ERALERGVGEVGEEALELCRAEQALVDEAPGGEADDGEVRFVDAGRGRGPLDPAPDHVERALECLLVSAPPLDEELPDDGGAPGRDSARVLVAHRDVAPAEGAMAFLGPDADAQLFA